MQDDRIFPIRPVILSSGGMDSFLAWYLFYRDKNAVNLFVNIGQKYLTKELESFNALSTSIPDFQVIYHVGPAIGHTDTPTGIIPNRNAYLILAASTYGTEIVLGVLNGEINSDKSRTFFMAMEQVLNVANMKQYWNPHETKFTVFSPLRFHSKSSLIDLYLKSGGKPEWLSLTTSCYSSVKGRCGACPSCFKRWVAMRNNQLEEEYLEHPVIWGLDSGVIAKARSGQYDQVRANEILHATRDY